ncbi:MAG: multidrug effflux MFS transporter [Rhizobiaceae bacterium]|nr:multidrug effflux MFS transporter [Rhizobiaceae bacterium]
MSERRTSLVGALLVAIGPISMALYTPAMPTLVRIFETTDSTIKLTLALYFAGFAFTQLLCGPLSDAYGRRRVTVLFMGIYLVGALIAVVAPTVEWLLAARVLQGVGASVGVATSRAIVRDQFVGETSARIMNTIGIMLAIGPALAPTIGGIVLDLSGWHAIFVVMVIFGIGVIGVTLGFMRETTVPDPRLIRPRALLSSYGRVLGSRTFLAASLTLGGSVGALYTLATVLPFVLIDRAGLSPTQYGVGMLGQSGLFFAGSVAMRFLLPRVSAYRLVLPGLACIGLAGVSLIASIALVEPSYVSIMAPVGLYAFGIAFVMPAMTTASLAQFPDIAGAAAAALGFVQMGMGLVGGLACAAIGEPVLATAIVIPALAAIAIAAYAVFVRGPSEGLGEPVASVPAPDLVPLHR